MMLSMFEVLLFVYVYCNLPMHKYAFQSLSLVCCSWQVACGNHKLGKKVHIQCLGESGRYQDMSHP